MCRGRLARAKAYKEPRAFCAGETPATRKTAFFNGLLPARRVERHSATEITKNAREAKRTARKHKHRLSIEASMNHFSRTREFGVVGYSGRRYS